MKLYVAKAIRKEKAAMTSKSMFNSSFEINLKHRLTRQLKSDSGSAIVEFVALAIPLFIPVFMYLNQFSGVSVNQEIARSMAREVLRVYVISENESAAQDLSGKATQLLARQWKLTNSEIASLRTHLECSRYPCLSADGRIKLTITFTDQQTGRIVSASSQEHLSPWLP